MAVLVLDLCEFDLFITSLCQYGRCNIGCDFIDHVYVIKNIHHVRKKKSLKYFRHNFVKY